MFFSVGKKKKEKLLTFCSNLNLHCSKALRKEALTVYGDGKQTRSFQYVSDLVKFLYISCLIHVQDFLLLSLQRYIYIHVTVLIENFMLHILFRM